MGSDGAIVLLTRPKAQSHTFRRMLGVSTAIISPIVKICPVSFVVDLDAYELLVFASQNAVRVAGETLALRGRRAVAVGKKSAQVALDLGMNAVAAQGTADALVAAVKALEPTGRVLFLRGVHTRGDVENRLVSDGIETDSVIVYDQVAQDLSPTAHKVLRGTRPVLMPLFSPRSARLLSGQIQDIGATAPLGLIGMSKAVLGAWDGPLADFAICAPRPTAQDMARETLRQIAGWA